MHARFVGRPHRPHCAVDGWADQFLRVLGLITGKRRCGVHEHIHAVEGFGPAVVAHQIKGDMVDFGVGKQGVDLGLSLLRTRAGTNPVPLLEELPNNVFRYVAGCTGNEHRAHVKIISRLVRVSLRSGRFAPG